MTLCGEGSVGPVSPHRLEALGSVPARGTAAGPTAPSRCRVVGARPGSPDPARRDSGPVLPAPCRGKLHLGALAEVRPRVPARRDAEGWGPHVG